MSNFNMPPGVSTNDIPGNEPKTAQEQFDEKYITSAEICKELRVGRTTVLNAKRRGLLPDAVLVNGGLVCIWERAKARPYIDAWKVVLNVRKGATSA